jgi:uncharacterized protein (DUF1330 family)
MNYAHSGITVFQRRDEESVPDFRARARSFVAELGGGVLAWGAPESLEWVDAEPETIVITGGTSEDSSGDIARFSIVIEREDDESVEAFRARARETAIAAGSDQLVFGGLPPMNFTDEQTKGE